VALSAVVQFWHGRSLDDTAPASRFWREWWYDSARWGPLASVRPEEGETMGVFVASGDLRQRFFSQGSCPRVCEISNVAMVPFTSGYAKLRYRSRESVPLRWGMAATVKSVIGGGRVASKQLRLGPMAVDAYTASTPANRTCHPG
jgi:hypothetical protein